MAIEDAAKQAGDFVKQNAEKVNEALKSDKAEEISDKILDGVAGLADKITGGKHSEKINELRDQADEKFGNE